MIMIDVRRRIASDSCATELHVFAQRIGLGQREFDTDGRILKGKPVYLLPLRHRLRLAIQAGASPVAIAELEKRAVER